MRLIFVRHPQTEANVRHVIYGRMESDYSPGGRASIPGILAALHDVGIDVMISSPLLRTRHLAEQIAADHQIPQENIAMDGRVIEFDCGIFENMTREAAMTQYETEYKSLMEDYENYAIPEGESFHVVYERVAEFLKELYKKYEEAPDEEKTVVVVSHSAVIHAALSYLLKIELKDIWHVKVEPGGIVDLDYRCDFAMLQSLSGPYNVRAAKR